MEGQQPGSRAEPSADAEPAHDIGSGFYDSDCGDGVGDGPPHNRWRRGGLEAGRLVPRPCEESRRAPRRR